MGEKGEASVRKDRTWRRSRVGGLELKKKDTLNYVNPNNFRGAIEKRRTVLRLSRKKGTGRKGHEKGRWGEEFIALKNLQEGRPRGGENDVRPFQWSGKIASLKNVREERVTTADVQANFFVE